MLIGEKISVVASSGRGDLRDLHGRGSKQIARCTYHLVGIIAFACMLWVEFAADGGGAWRSLTVASLPGALGRLAQLSEDIGQAPESGGLAASCQDTVPEVSQRGGSPNSGSPRDIASPETSGYAAQQPNLTQLTLRGDWTRRPEGVRLNHAGGRIQYRATVRELNLVLGSRSPDHPIRFRVTLDGQPPGENHGADTDKCGNGAVTETRHYQLIRQTAKIGSRAFEIRFLDPGVEAYAFIFG